MTIIGSGNDLEIDDIGGGNSLTSRIAVISCFSGPCADINYLFAQVIVHEQRVDTTPNCDNMFSDVGTFATENDLIAATSPATRVHIRNVNTGTFIEADMQTPSGVVEYEGSAGIDGVPGTAAPVALTSPNAAETKAGKVFPVGNQIDYFDDIPVACIDTAMPVVTVPAECLGKTGYELPAGLDTDKVLLARIEPIRLQADKAMGLGGVSNTVIPKPVLIPPAQKGRAINVCYFMPYSYHRVLAITDAIAVSSSCALEGTVTRQIVPSVGYGNINIKHPSGALDVHLGNEGQDATALHAFAIRTTKEIFSDEVYLP